MEEEPNTMRRYTHITRGRGVLMATDELVVNGQMAVSFGGVPMGTCNGIKVERPLTPQELYERLAL